MIRSKFNHALDAARFVLAGDNKSELIMIVTILSSFVVPMWTLSLSPTSAVVIEIAYAQSSGIPGASPVATNEIVTPLRYLNPSFGIELNYPSSWQALELWKAPSPSNSVVAFFPTTNNDSATNASSFDDILLISMQASQGKTLNEYTADSLNAYRDPASNITITKSFPTTLAGIPAHEINYRENFGANELMKKQIWTIIDNKAYVVTFGADASQYADYLPDVDQMIDSLEIARVPPELTNTESGPFRAGVLPAESNGPSQEYFTI